MVRLENVSVRSGAFKISNINFEIKEGECLALMGKSGSGKTSIMEALCGLREVLKGNIWINGEDKTLSPPNERNVGLVPQDNVLFPTMTVREHIAYGPKLRKWSHADIASRVSEVAERLGIADLLERKPSSLSGGEAKRVAIGRAIAVKPDLLCLDESFTGLDNETLLEVMNLVKETIQCEKICTLLITHQKQEAEYLANEIYKL